jgi:hypothetical protein
MIGADGQENVPHREWLLIFDRVLNEVMVEMKGQGREDEFFGARVSCIVTCSLSLAYARRPRSFIVQFV